MDRLNNLQRREWYEEYFSAVDVSQIERDKRVQLAEDIDDTYDELFDLIMVIVAMNQTLDREYLTGYLQTRIADVGDGSDYLNEYAYITAQDVVNTTLDHEGDEWYTSEDRKLLLAAGDAQTIGNYEQFEKALAQGKTHKTWKSELLRTTRKEHSEMHGKTIPIKEKFVFSDCEMLFPRDAVNGTAKQVVNCRCSLKFDVQDDTITDDRENEKAGYGEPEIDWDNFTDEKMDEKLSKLEEPEEVTSEIKAKILDILDHRNGTHFEDLAYINATTGIGEVNKDFDYYVKGESKCKPNETMDAMLKEANKNGEKIIGVHNHPGSSMVSPEDVIVAQERGYKYGIVVAHNGNIYQYRITRDAKYTPVDYSSIQHRLSQYFTSLYNPSIISMEDATKDLVNLGIDLKVL